MGGLLVTETILESKTGKTRERGGGGNMKSLLTKFGNMANGTYDEHFGSKKTILVVSL